MRIHHLPLLAALTVIPAGCASYWSPDITPENGLAVWDEVPETSPVPVRENRTAWRDVERIRLQGVDLGDRLPDLLQHSDAGVRERAAFTIGSLGWVRLERLGLRLKEEETEDDSDPQIKTWSEALRGALNDPVSDVRAAAIDALSRLGIEHTAWWTPIVGTGVHPKETLAAVRAVHRIREDKLAPSDRSSLELKVFGAARTLEELQSEFGAGIAREALWSAAFASQRQNWASGGEHSGYGYFNILDGAANNPTARVFAAAGVRRTIPEFDAEELGSHPSPAATHLLHDVQAGLELALDDSDWRVVYEIVGAAEKHGDPTLVPKLAELRREHHSAHVRAACVKALASIGSKSGDRSVCATEILGANMDSSMTVRVAALEAFALLYGGEVEGGIREAIASPKPTMRAGAARAASHLEPGIGMPILWSLTADPHPRVAGAAYTVLATKIGDEPDDLVRATLIEHLVTQDDIGLKLGLVMELGDHFTTDDVWALASCLGRADEDIGVELEFNALQALGAIGTPKALDIVRAGLKHPNEWIQWVCWGELMQHDEVHPEPNVAPKWKGPEVLPQGRPVVVIDTTKGAMTFELYPEDAPLHVVSFLELVERGHYNGLDFHRVVPNFVIQGGCPRGDGNGGGTWLGEAEALPAEFNPRPYARGVLGMPRNQNPDSNGSQIFVTHRPTPHLDGRYVVFGALLDGFDVLDAVEVGDKILSAYVIAVE